MWLISWDFVVLLWCRSCRVARKRSDSEWMCGIELFVFILYLWRMLLSVSVEMFFFLVDVLFFEQTFSLCTFIQLTVLIYCNSLYQLYFEEKTFLPQLIQTLMIRFRAAVCQNTKKKKIFQWLWHQDVWNKPPKPHYAVLLYAHTQWLSFFWKSNPVYTLLNMLENFEFSGMSPSKLGLFQCQNFLLLSFQKLPEVFTVHPPELNYNITSSTWFRNLKI